MDACSFQQYEPSFQAEEVFVLLVVDVELEEVMRKLPVVDRVSGVNPFTEEDKPIQIIVFLLGSAF